MTMNVSHGTHSMGSKPTEDSGRGAALCQLLIQSRTHYAYVTERVQDMILEFRQREGDTSLRDEAQVIPFSTPALVFGMHSFIQAGVHSGISLQRGQGKGRVPPPIKTEEEDWGRVCETQRHMAAVCDNRTAYDRCICARIHRVPCWKRKACGRTRPRRSYLE